MVSQENPEKNQSNHWLDIVQSQNKNFTTFDVNVLKNNEELIEDCLDLSLSVGKSIKDQ